VTIDNSWEFQSAPGGEAGGNFSSKGNRTPMCSFNPPPAVRPGETQRDGQCIPTQYRFNPPPAVRPGETDDPVSFIRKAKFQSAPGGEAGGNVARRRPKHIADCFNPPPALRPGETEVCREIRASVGFQSAPGGEAGGNGGCIGRSQCRQCFNPPPAVRPGETLEYPAILDHARGFNPPPAVRPGETFAVP